eukprot:TRINITY_DN14971_c0_g1_i1.p1 TRINITY_DN14971_c0_g1~~TRINITY_DN14971_c0_g1_i1.p1  ORF type:complete len:646 (+),score=115.14 TRINITY_DN14971_c0_g1_i1:96-2033(+)
MAAMSINMSTDLEQASDRAVTSRGFPRFYACSAAGAFLWRLFEFISSVAMIGAKVVELSLRGAVFIAVAAPLIVPMGKGINEEGKYINAALGTLFVFTLNRPFGYTLEFAIDGLAGTVLAAVNKWLVSTLCVGAISTEADVFSFTWWIYAFEGTCFMLGVVAARCNNTIQMFALFWHTYIWMSLLTPNYDEPLNMPQLMVTEQPLPPTIGAILITAQCAAASVLATLLPWPATSFAQALKSTARATKSTSEVFHEAVECYTEERRDRGAEDRVRRRLRSLFESLRFLDEHVRNSTWECFGSGQSRQIRRNVRSVHRTLLENIGRLSFAVDSCSGGGNNSSQVLSGCPSERCQALRPSLRTVASEAATLLASAATFACHRNAAKLTEDARRQLIESQSKAVVASVWDLEEQLSRSGTISKGHDLLLHERVFCSCVAAFGRLSLDLAESLAGSTKGLPCEIEDDDYDEAMPTAEGLAATAAAAAANRVSTAMRLGGAVFGVFWISWYCRIQALDGCKAWPPAAVVLLWRTNVRVGRHAIIQRPEPSSSWSSSASNTFWSLFRDAVKRAGWSAAALAMVLSELTTVHNSRAGFPAFSWDGMKLDGALEAIQEHALGAILAIAALAFVDVVFPSLSAAAGVVTGSRKMT